MNIICIRSFILLFIKMSVETFNELDFNESTEGWVGGLLKNLRKGIMDRREGKYVNSEKEIKEYCDHEFDEFLKKDWLPPVDAEDVFVDYGKWRASISIEWNTITILNFPKNGTCSEISLSREDGGRYHLKRSYWVTWVITNTGYNDYLEIGDVKDFLDFFKGEYEKLSKVWDKYLKKEKAKKKKGMDKIRKEHKLDI